MPGPEPRALVRLARALPRPEGGTSAPGLQLPPLAPSMRDSAGNRPRSRWRRLTPGRSPPPLIPRGPTSS
eukprot:10791049-Lingulodinium_polyedra.AAC.1